jgi:rubredoxin
MSDVFYGRSKDQGGDVMEGNTGRVTRRGFIGRIGRAAIALAVVFKIGPSAVAMAAGPEKAVYVCQYCGYIYDPAAGDASQNVPPGTAFEELPDTWHCPNCGLGKDMFKRS